MAKAGVTSTGKSTGTKKSVKTRQALIEATILTLRTEGFSGASARTIADRAGLNQGLVFYHFGSVIDLLLAALDEVSRVRMEKYSAELANVASPAELLNLATQIFKDDLDTGYVTVLVEMIGGAASTPGLGAEIALRIGPWFTFAKESLDKTFSDTPIASLLPSGDVAYMIVALYLGLEMLTHLDGDRDPALRLFAHAHQLVALIGTLSAFIPSKPAS
ncbi:MAG: TetR/AcrR family transcriptional regulator [Acidimicrobiales bacterium]|jgi:AcrR family transcriptional regulator